MSIPKGKTQGVFTAWSPPGQSSYYYCEKHILQKWKKGQSSCHCTTGERTIKCIKRAVTVSHWKLNFVI